MVRMSSKHKWCRQGLDLVQRIGCCKSTLTVQKKKGTQGRFGTAIASAWLIIEIFDSPVGKAEEEEQEAMY